MLEKKSNKNNSDELKYWDQKYSVPNAFGEGPTKLALMALETIKKNQIKTILELGCGQGRDSLFFAKQNYAVTSIDFSPEAIDFVSENARMQKLDNIKTIVQDLRKNFIFKDKFDLLYSNLALQFFNAKELGDIFKKIHSSLVNKGHFIFSTKKSGDKYYGTGIKIAENAYQSSGITRYFFDKNEIEKMLKDKFKVNVFGHERHKNLDKTESVWWYIFCQKK